MHVLRWACSGSSPAVICSSFSKIRSGFFIRFLCPSLSLRCIFSSCADWNSPRCRISCMSWKFLRIPRCRNTSIRSSIRGCSQGLRHSRLSRCRFRPTTSLLRTNRAGSTATLPHRPSDGARSSAAIFSLISSSRCSCASFTLRSALSISPACRNFSSISRTLPLSSESRCIRRSLPRS